MAFFRNPPEADKSRRLPCEMRSLFIWGQSSKSLVRHTDTYASAQFFDFLDLAKILISELETAYTYPL
jgi:hypothetical protein